MPIEETGRRGKLRRPFRGSAVRRAALGSSQIPGTAHPGIGLRPRGGRQGQSAASSGSYDDSDTLTQQDQGYGDSTSAQRSGGQSIRGQGSTDQDEEQSDLDGQ
ncbi:hypothetical protein [Sphingomonas sp.]|uniref:hypothetical protein n=1 Tax=Sphingomonas sp. TaxID=28214 RepID=UPI0025D9A922|nr:hypothetical protein [Sphingomonas sp.]